MTTPHLALEDARRIAIAAQALDRQPFVAATKADVLQLVRRLGCVQIDTIHVVARSPYFVLWSRLGSYDPRWLDELLFPDRQVFEYWAHAASIVPIEHWPLFRSRMLQHANGETGWWREWRHENAHVVQFVLDEIRAKGPLGAADFETPEGHKGGWWEWKPAKHALDLLWSSGELMIERRVNFHRRYELRERILPGWDDDQIPGEVERRTRLVALALNAMGLATVRQLADYFRQRQDGLHDILETFVANGEAERVQVADWTAPVYVARSWWERFSAGLGQSDHTTLLSPFDSLIWDRERALALWGFDYKIECYTPAPKRRYGYFTLPIFWRGQLIGRLDPKAERKAGIFRVKALHLEPGVPLHETVIKDVAQAIQQCANWHNTPNVVIDWSDPEPLAARLHECLH